MTNYYLTSSFGEKRNAGSKARKDVDQILKEFNFEPLIITENIQKKRLDKLKNHIMYFRDYLKVIIKLKKNDVLFYQHPIQGALEFYLILNVMKKRKIKVISIVHDLELFRKWDLNYSQKKSKLNDVSILQKCDYVILHNQKMIEKLSDEIGINKNKLIDLEIFDYLFKKNNDKSFRLSEDVTIAGNLRREKSKYVYDLNKLEQKFTLYGVGYDENESSDNIEYKGSLSPDEIVSKLTGKFGLVWDGDSTESCTGSTGEYLKINNPHKTSLYLAAGIPVIIWDKAALSDFIQINNCGFVVSNLNEIPKIINSLTNDEYSIMKQNCIELSEKLSEGFFTKKAIKKVLINIYGSVE